MYIYKIPKDCNYVLVAQTFMYTVQHIVNANDTVLSDDPLSIEQNMSGSFECSSSIDSTDITSNNAVGVVSCNTTSLHIGEDAVFVENENFFINRKLKLKNEYFNRIFMNHL